jgi:DNA polymerase epsilon subunit 1
MIPPRSKPKQHLYKYTTSEAQFQESSKSLALEFTHPSIEGVYELSVPLIWRPLIELGCVCRLTTAASRGNFRDTYALDDLVPFTSGYSSFHSTFGKAATNYLAKDNVKQIYVYHSASEGRGALFAAVRPQQGKGTVFLVNAHAVQGQINTLLKPLINKHPTITFDLVRVSTMDEGYKALHALLAELARARGVTVLLLQSHRSGAQLAKNVPALDDFPRVAIPSNAADNDYPPLNWELQTTKALAHRFASVNAWWTQSVQLARYANLPVGNLEGDLTLLTSDIFFARQLKEAQHLLWMSSSNLPDLGGSQEDDAVFSEELINPELSEPGFYHPFCVEFDVFNLAINTVLEASHIGDIEGGSGLLAFEGDSHSFAADNSDPAAGTPKTYDQSSICTNEFKVLRKLITRWSVDVTSSNTSVSACADGLLSQFYRWVSTPHALLYDPAIHKLIHDLMRKVH